MYLGEAHEVHRYGKEEKESAFWGLTHSIYMSSILFFFFWYRYMSSILPKHSWGHWHPDLHCVLFELRMTMQKLCTIGHACHGY